MPHATFGTIFRPNHMGGPHRRPPKSEQHFLVKLKWLPEVWFVDKNKRGGPHQRPPKSEQRFLTKLKWLPEVWFVDKKICSENKSCLKLKNKGGVQNLGKM